MLQHVLWRGSTRIIKDAAPARLVLRTSGTAATWIFFVNNWSAKECIYVCLVDGTLCAYTCMYFVARIYMCIYIHMYIYIHPVDQFTGEAIAR